jgi:hypothetical protein
MTYGCHNRKPFKTMMPAQNGWYMDGVTRTPKMTPVKFRMAAECQYTLSDLGQKDDRCTGCKHRKEPA